MSNLGLGPHHRFALGLVHLSLRLDIYTRYRNLGLGGLVGVGGGLSYILPIYARPITNVTHDYIGHN